MSQKEKLEAVHDMIKFLPRELKPSFMENECKIPLPVYDYDGVFKSYLQQKNAYKYYRQSDYNPKRVSPFSIPNGDLRTFKDFENLQMINHISLKDPILETFLEKAKEMEQNAGNPPETEQHSRNRVKIKTQAEAIKEFNSQTDPLRYYSVIDFDRAIRKTQGILNKKNQTSKQNELREPEQQQPSSARDLPSISSNTAINCRTSSQVRGQPTLTPINTKINNGTQQIQFRSEINYVSSTKASTFQPQKSFISSTKMADPDSSHVVMFLPGSVRRTRFSKVSKETENNLEQSLKSFTSDSITLNQSQIQLQPNIKELAHALNLQVNKEEQNYEIPTAEVLQKKDSMTNRRLALNSQELNSTVISNQPTPSKIQEWIRSQSRKKQTPKKLRKLDDSLLYTADISSTGDLMSDFDQKRIQNKINFSTSRTQIKLTESIKRIKLMAEAALADSYRLQQTTSPLVSSKQQPVRQHNTTSKGHKKNKKINNSWSNTDAGTLYIQQLPRFVVYTDQNQVIQVKPNEFCKQKAQKSIYEVTVNCHSQLKKQKIKSVHQLSIVDNCCQDIQQPNTKIKQKSKHLKNFYDLQKQQPSDSEKNSCFDQTTSYVKLQNPIPNMLKHPTKKTSQDEKHENKTCIEDSKLKTVNLPPTKTAQNFNKVAKPISQDNKTYHFDLLSSDDEVEKRLKQSSFLHLNTIVDPQRKVFDLTTIPGIKGPSLLLQNKEI